MLAAYEPEAPDDLMATVEEKKALDRLARALRRAVNDDSLWKGLASQAAGVNQPDFPTFAEAFLTTIATVLGDAHTDLLERCGYQTPPPPPAFRLVEQTRQAVLSGDLRPRWGKHHVQDAHDELRTFVERLEVMLMAGVGIRALSFRARTVGVGGLLLLALYASEWKVGDEPSLQLSLSPQGEGQDRNHSA